MKFQPKTRGGYRVTDLDTNRLGFVGEVEITRRVLIAWDKSGRTYPGGGVSDYDLLPVKPKKRKKR